MKNTIFVILLLLALVITSNSQAQVGIGIMTANPSAQLDVTSTKKGFLAPRMTMVQRDSIAIGDTPATGLLIYQTDNTPGFYYYNGSAWVAGVGSQGPTGATGTVGFSSGDVYYFNNDVDAIPGSYQDLNRTISIGTQTEIDTMLLGGANPQLIQSFLTPVGDPNTTVLNGGNWNFEFWVSKQSGGGMIVSVYVQIYIYHLNGTSTLISPAVPIPVVLINHVGPFLYLISVPIAAQPILATDRIAVEIWGMNQFGTKDITLYFNGSTIGQVTTTLTGNQKGDTGVAGATGPQGPAGADVTLPIGADGQVLTSVGGTHVWQNLPSQAGILGDVAALKAEQITQNYEISNNASRISVETSTRASADAVLNSVTSNLDSRISAETSDRAFADAELNSITSMLSAEISAETSARASADVALNSVTSNLSARILVETSARASADAALNLVTSNLSARILVETSARASADVALNSITSMLSAEISVERVNRMNADTSQNIAISNNASAIASVTPTSIGAIGTATPNGATITAGVLSLAPADATNGGIVTAADQVFGGVKTFNNKIVANGTVGVGTTTPSPSAKLEVSSTTQGFLPPRMTYAQKMAIQSPAQGLMIYCTDCGSHGEPEYYNGLAWVNMMGGLPHGFPVLTTSPVTTITGTSASLGGNITSDDGSEIIARGVVWGTTSNPDISLTTLTSNGAGIGAFTSSLAGLTIGTVYYVRSYATNSVATGYGAEVSFKTLGVPELAATTAVIPTDSTTVSSGGNVTSGDGSDITARGVVWGTSSNPDISLSTLTSDGTGRDIFTSRITGLTAFTKYYVRSYATNSVGTGYGTEVSFIAGIGMSYLGGILAYILQPADPGYNPAVPHGLIAAATDQTNPNLGGQWSGIQWYNGSFDDWNNGFITATGAIGTALGTGLANTNTIIANQGEVKTSYAAGLARAFTGGGFTDWYLPSIDELKMLYYNRKAIGGFSEPVFTGGYWSSSEVDKAIVWAVLFMDNPVNETWYQGSKNGDNKVRAVRSF